MRCLERLRTDLGLLFAAAGMAGCFFFSLGGFYRWRLRGAAAALAAAR